MYFTRQRIQRQTPSESSATTEETGLFRKRPFAEFGQTESDEEQTQQLPDLQTQLERAARFNQSLSRLKVHGSRPPVQPKFAFGQPKFHHQQPTNFVARQALSMPALATNQPIQPQEENEEQAPVQTQLETNSVQTFSQPTDEEQEETPLQAKAESADLQQPELEEEQTPLQPKLETTSVQRFSESAQEEQEELPLQAKAESADLQQPEAEEEEPLPGIQQKVVVGQPGDAYEQEADRVAQQVMAMPSPTANSQPVQRQVEEEQEESSVQKSALADSITPLIQRASEEEEAWQLSANGGSQASGDLETQLKSTKGGGSPLPNEVRSFMEPRFGADFSGVRVHTDSTAAQMNNALGAQAFTHGNDIYFGAGKSPGKNDLTAHELTHTVQQTGAVQRKSEGIPAASTAKQSLPQSEAESSDVESVTTQIVESLSADPEDRAERLIGVLARLAPSIRQVVVARVQAQLSPQQQQTLSRTLARLGSERDAASASQEEISDGRSRVATDNQSQPETEPGTHQTSQVAAENRQSGKSTSEVRPEQSPTPPHNRTLSSSNPER